MRFMLHENNGYRNTPSSPQLSIPAPLSFSYLFHHFLSWSLCISTVLMIHVLIPLCQGPRAASITLCPCLLLALAALTLHPLSLIKKRKKKKLLLSSATQTLSQYLGPDLKSFFFSVENYLNSYFTIHFFLFLQIPALYTVRQNLLGKLDTDTCLLYHLYYDCN